MSGPHLSHQGIFFSSNPHSLHPCDDDNDDGGAAAVYFSATNPHDDTCGTVDITSGLSHGISSIGSVGS